MVVIHRFDCSFEQTNGIKLKFFRKKNFTAPFYGWSSTVSKLQSHYEETVYFLPLSSLDFWYSILQQNKEFKKSSKTLILVQTLKKELKMSESGVQILMHNNFRQTTGINIKFFSQALCWEYYSKPKNLVVIQFIKYIPQNSKIEKKTPEKCKNLEGFIIF